MEIAGVALAIVATADLCFKYGRILVKTCETFKGAEAEIDERVLCVESQWKRTSIQLDFIKRIWENLDQEHQAIQTRILQVLVSKLNVTISKLESIIKKKTGDPTMKGQGTGVRKWKYVVVKQCLDDSIEDLASWQRLFDPSWFLILKIASPLIDQELNNKHLTTSSLASASTVRDALKEQPQQKIPIFLPEADFKTARIHDIPFSSAKCMQRADSDKWRKTVRELARKLTSVDPLIFGLLQCHGVVQAGAPSTTSFNFIFKIPPQLDQPPLSLRSYLLSPLPISLTTRFSLAQQLAKATSYIQTLGFVHKNIRPETILGFHSASGSTPGAAANLSLFLVGFEDIRTADGHTLRVGDARWEKNLYRHPLRQGLSPEVVYTMQHDIYSLGVCLLEIGLWASFVHYDDNNDDNAANPVPSTTLGVSPGGVELKTPALIKGHLVALAKRELPARMGERYEKVIVNCLTCLDEENVDFGDPSEFEDEDGVLVGVRYIEKILLKLEDIQV